MRTIIVFALATVLSSMTVSADPWLGDVRILAADEGYQWEAAVAYNSVHDEYLAVWTTDVSGVEEVYGIRVDSEGVPIGLFFAISEPGNNQWDPAVAYDPVNDRYFVTWTFDYSGNGTDTDILGRFIPWDGPSPTWPAFGVDVALSNQQNSAVAYNPITLEYLIAWDDHEEGFPFLIYRPAARGRRQHWNLGLRDRARAPWIAGSRGSRGIGSGTSTWSSTSRTVRGTKPTSTAPS